MPIEFSNQPARTSLQMPPALRSSLKRLASNTYTRGPRRWETPSAPDISQHTVTELALKNLVKVRHGYGRDRLTLTELGREIADAVSAKRRKGAAQ